MGDIDVNLKAQQDVDLNLASQADISLNLASQADVGVFIPSEIPGVGVFCDEYQTVYDLWTNKPSSVDALIQNTLYLGLVDGGLWSKKDVLYITGIHTNTDGEAQLMVLDPGGDYDLTLVNAPDFEAYKGFKSDGVTSYAEMHWNPVDDGLKFTQNDCSLGFISLENCEGFKTPSGFVSGGARCYLMPRSSGKANMRMNDGVAITSDIIDDAIGHYRGNRTASNARNIFKDKENLCDDNLITGGLAGLDRLYLASINGVLSISYFFNGYVPTIDYAEGYTLEEHTAEVDLWEAYLDNYGLGML